VKPPLQSRTAESSVEAFVLVGPTASGKTEVAQWIAERHPYEIVSADSMLVYEGMDVGTAKPTHEERSRVRYHGVDLVSPDQPFSVAEYRRRVLDALPGIGQRGKQPLVVGGTGLYIKALMSGLQAPAPSSAARDEWETVLERDGIEALAGMLKDRAPDLHASLDDPRNPRRVMRALEMAAAGITGPAGTWDGALPQPPVAGLAMPADTLNSRIEARVERMYAAGILDEMRELLRRHGELSATAGQAIGYGEAAAVLLGECSVGEARERTVVRTRRLAKRQRTWFRHQVAVRWIDIAPADATETIANHVMALWREHGPARIACE